jgi:hypothetical protein
MSANPSEKIRISVEDYTVEQSEEIEFAKRQIQKLNEEQENIWLELLEKLQTSDERGFLFDYVFNDIVIENDRE